MISGSGQIGGFRAQVSTGGGGGVVGEMGQFPDISAGAPNRTKRADSVRESPRAHKNANGREFAANGPLRFPAQNRGSGPTKIGRSKWGAPVDPKNGLRGSV